MRLQAGLTKLTVAAQFTAKEFVWVWHATGLNHRAQASQLLHCSCAAGCLALCDGDMDSQVPPASPRARPLPPLTSPGPPTQAEHREHAPMSSANPPTGRRQVPVTNCNRRILFSLSISLTTYNKNTAGEWDPCHPQAHSLDRFGHSPVWCSTRGTWSSPRL